MGWGGRLDCEVNGAGAVAHGENVVLATGNIGKIGGTACILGSAINSEISPSTTLPVRIAEHRDIRSDQSVLGAGLAVQPARVARLTPTITTTTMA